MSDSTALERPAPVALARYELRPKSLDDAARIVQMLAGSRLLPPELQDPASLFLILLQAADLDLSIVQAIRGMSIIKGKPVINADLGMAVCVGHPKLCKYFRPIEDTAERVTYETFRIGDTQARTASFSMDDARRAGLLGKGSDSNWARYPSDMMHARAKGRVAKRYYPDLLYGVLIREEYEDEGAIDMSETTPGQYAPPVVPVPSGARPNVPPRPTAPPPASGMGTSPSAPVAREPIEVTATTVERTPAELCTHWGERIGATTTLAELEALRPELAKTTGDTRTVLRHAYDAQKAMLAAPKPTWGDTPSVPARDREPGEDDE